MTRITILILLTLTLTAASVFGQRPSLPTALYDTNIENQFNYLSSLSRTQEGFKLIRPSNLEIVKKSVLDSIVDLQKKIVELKQNSASFDHNLSVLQDSVNSLSQSLEIEKSKVDNISFLGIPFSKGGYHSFVWTVIIAVSLLFLITLASYKRARTTSKEQTKNAEELQEELQTQRKKALETEQKLKRQLLDEQLRRDS